MDLTRNDPSRTLSQLRNELNRFLGEAGPAWPTREEDESNIVTSQWLPAVDIKEDADRFVLYADIPGVDPKDIDVTMENGMLTIRGERKTEQRQENERYTRYERAHGVFYRRFSLPDSANAEGIEAHGKNGVLEIVIPKTEAQRPRRITVES